ncbi:MAG TPA: toxin-antitoxin system HicB family antitoxin [Gaiellaceae bacterium]|nr:toxin-antitoxin system HicB family antitoxin [Gaiellaceae bacterium]
METARFIAALERDLAAVAAVGDDETAAAAERLIQALRGSAGMRLMETLGEAALEISDQLPEGHVEVRLAGPDPQLVYVGAEPAEPAAVPAEDGLAARITLRLYDSLKRELEEAAAREGMSLNAWLVRALSRSVASPAPRSRGNRLSGYGRN